MATLDPAALAGFGHLPETFVVSELLKQATWLDGIAGHGHWRTHDGDEVDILFDATGPRFLAGIALCTGERSYTFDDRLRVLPIDRLWA